MVQPVLSSSLPAHVLVLQFARSIPLLALMRLIIVLLRMTLLACPSRWRVNTREPIWGRAQGSQHGDRGQSAPEQGTTSGKSFLKSGFCCLKRGFRLWGCGGARRGAAGACGLHLSGHAGKPKFVASMRTTYIMSVETAWASVPEDTRSGHWLNTEVDGGQKGGPRRVRDVMDCLLLGDAPCYPCQDSFREPAMPRYGRLGAVGSPWLVAVRE